MLIMFLIKVDNFRKLQTNLCTDALYYINDLFLLQYSFQTNRMKSQFSICVIVLVCALVSAFQKSQCVFHNFKDQEKQDQETLPLQENINIVFDKPNHQHYGHSHKYKSRRSHESQNVSIHEEMLAYSGKFRNFKFNFEEAELQELAYDVRDLYAKDKIALFFISAYFIRACQLLQKQQTPAHLITKIIKRKIKSLMNITSIQTFRKQKYGGSPSLNFDSDYWHEVQKSLEQITPKKYILAPQDKDTQIQDIILQMVSLAHQHYSIFKKLTSSICKQNNGFNHHINYKIKSKQQINQMKRVKQKLLRTYFKTHGDRCLNTFLNIGWKRALQNTGFQELLNKVYIELNQVEFVVKDILRSKCMFSRVQDIRSAALMLISQINGMRKLGWNVKLVEFQYRLDKITCDILLVVQIDDLLTEMQLSLDFDEHLFEISHKMYEMSRSKVFSPIVQLFDWFLNIAPQFLYKMRTFVQERDSRFNQSGTQLYQNSQRLIKQYELLNNFFHLTNSYHPNEKISEWQFEKFVSHQINKYEKQILTPFETEI